MIGAITDRESPHTHLAEHPMRSWAHWWRYVAVVLCNKTTYRPCSVSRLMLTPPAVIYDPGLLLVNVEHTTTIAVCTVDDVMVVQLSAEIGGWLLVKHFNPSSSMRQRSLLKTTREVFEALLKINRRSRRTRSKSCKPRRCKTIPRIISVIRLFLGYQPITLPSYVLMHISADLVRNLGTGNGLTPIRIRIQIAVTIELFSFSSFSSLSHSNRLFLASLP